MPRELTSHKINECNDAITIKVLGATQEVLISILIDRLEGFQTGPYANDDNRLALSHLREAQAALHRRTRERLARGVEGTHTP